jgi:hypothetical protein
MAKVIDLGSAGPDDPIYKSGLRVNSLPASKPVTDTSRKSTDGGLPQPALPTDLEDPNYGKKAPANKPKGNG